MSTVYFNLSAGNLSQNWSDTGLISVNNDWSAVPSIMGYRGDELTAAIGADPRTLTANDANFVISALANQTNPNTFSTGGVAEFQIADPTIALNGSGTADAPYIVLHLDATGRQSVALSFTARDIDGSADNAAQPIAVQYRIGEIGSWTNVDGGYIADASVGPSLTGSQNLSVTLPAAANNQAQVQIRIITANAAGNDEWIGIDDIVVTSEPGAVVTTPVVSVAATDAGASESGDTATFTFTRTGDTSAALTVDYTLAGSATAADYDLAPAGGQITFAAGSATATLTLTAVDDLLSEGNESAVLTLTDGASYDVGVATATATIADNDYIRIYDIQGARHESAFDNQGVTTRGIVTLVASNGFYLQDALGDGNIATSDGIFVFTGSAPAVAVGDDVAVAGTVDEFRPGGASGIDNLTITQIVSPAVTVLSSGNAMPISILLGDGGRLPPLSVINDEATGAFDPANFDAVNDGLDFYESLEGMMVSMSGSIQVVGPTNNFGEVWVVTVNDALSDNDRGGVTISSGDFNPQRIQIDGIGSTAIGAFDVGTMLNSISGVVSYSFGNYEVLVNTSPTVAAASTITREVTDIVANATTLTYGSVNAENLDPSDGAAKFNGLAAQIVTNMKAPTIVALQEIQDNSGATNNGVTDASATAQMLIDAIIAAGGPMYSYVDVAPANNTSGGEPGGNIRVGFLYNSAAVSIVADPVTGALAKSLDVAAFDGSRDPLVVTFDFQGEQFTFINNHFSSKGADTGLYENTQPPALNSEAQRIPQAQVVNDYVDGLLTADPQAKVIVLGDLNDFTWSNPLKTLDGSIGGGTKILFELGEEMLADPAERYSYVFEGNSQELDHIYVSQAVLNQTGAFDVVHVNAEFANQFSDHDPAVASIRINSAPDAQDDAFSVNEDAELTGAVLGNDSDVDGDSLTVSLVSGPTNGMLTIDANGRFTYKPNADFNGADSFTYAVSDGKGGTDTANVAITVNPMGETFIGTSGDDTINGTDQDDIVKGGLGNDTINGGDGNDQLDGQQGHDTIHAAGGNDYLWGRDGDDTLDGGDGDDVVGGGNGIDTIYGGAGDDKLSGEAGDDFVYGGLGADQVDGGAGNDFLFGGDGADKMNGRDGNDRIAGGEGADDITLGAGSDLLVFDNAAGRDLVRDFTIGADKIVIDLAGFGISAADLIFGTGPSDADAAFIYDAAAGILRFDMDGTGAGAAVDIAAFIGKPALTAGDFQIV